MSNFEKINQYILPADLLMAMLRVYRFLGKNTYYQEQLSNHETMILEQTLERDTYFLANLIGVSLSDNRMRLIVIKNSEPRTNEERIVAKIKEVLRSIRTNASQYPYNSSDILDMINRIYGRGYASFDLELLQPKEKLKRRVKKESLKSRRYHFDTMIDEYQHYFEKSMYEHIFLSSIACVEMSNIAPFTKENDLALLLALYYMILRSEVDCFKYVSFYETLFNHNRDFKIALNTASLNYFEGYIQVYDLNRLLFKIIIESYQKLDEILSEFKYDQRVNKGDNVENTIMKLPNLFTKADIRTYHPYVSDSTITRALNKLKDENKIRPLGKGRTAHWVKIEPEEEKDFKRYFRNQ